MGSPPLAANQIRPPENPLDQVAQVERIRALMNGQQLSAQDLQQKQLQTQSMQMTLQGQQALRAAEQDPNWDPRDLDKSLGIMQKYSVPTDVAKNVLTGISQIREGLSKASTENLKAVQDAHGYFDDQLQAIKAAPDSQKQNAYQQSIQAIKQWGAQLPEGPGKQQVFSEIQNIPALYDPQWVDQQHARLRSMQYLTDEALKNAQTREASGKGAQAQAEADQINAKSNPNSPLYSPTPAALASGNIPGAQQIQAGLASQAGRVAGSEEAARFPYQQKLEQVRQQVAQSQQINRDAQDKIEANVLKPYEEKMNAVSQLQSAIQQAQNGNVTAARGVLLKLIGVTNPDGTKRFNNQEAERLLSQGNVGQRFAGTVQNLLTGDNWTPKMASDMYDFANAQGSVAADGLNRGIQNVNKLYGTNVGTGLLQSGNGGANSPGASAKLPPGATHIVPGRDGRNHYTNAQGTIDYGIAP